MKNSTDGVFQRIPRSLRRRNSRKRKFAIAALLLAQAGLAEVEMEHFRDTARRIASILLLTSSGAWDFDKR